LDHAGGARFANEAMAGFFTVVALQELERHRAARHQVDAGPHLAHAAFPKQAPQLVSAADLRPLLAKKRHGTRRNILPRIRGNVPFPPKPCTFTVCISGRAWAVRAAPATA